MRILLIKPPIRACRVEIGRHMPIGLAYLASALRADGHEVVLHDSLAHTDENHIVAPADHTTADREKLDRHPRWRHLIHWGSSWDSIRTVISRARPDVVGVSCMFTPYYETAYELARLARETVPDAWILLGGQHPTVAHHHAMSEKAIDVLVLGEAENSAVSLLRELGRSGDLTKVPGVAFRCGAGWCSCPVPREAAHVTGRAPWVSDLDLLPLPATDLVDFGHYDDSTTLITSRGCPFSCTFCTVHATVGKQFRARSPHRVVDEIEYYLAHHRVRRFRIEDDNFTFDPARVSAICREIRARGLDIDLYLPNGMTVVNLTPELVADMAAAGFRNLFLGLETTDPARLRKIRKGFTSLGKVTAGAEWFTAAGVDVSASLIVGLLGHGLDQVARDAVNLAAAGVPFGVNPFYPIPGSTDYETCRAAGLIDPLTELGLFEGFNFAIGSDVLSPTQLYWAWVAAQALSQWPEYVRAGVRSLATGTAGDLVDSVRKLAIAAERPPPVRDTFEVLAAPASTDGTDVTVRPDGCFCALQRVRERVAGGGPADFCLATGDVIAAAVGFHLGRPVWAEQISATVDQPGHGCTFRLHLGGPPEADRVHAAFMAELTASWSPLTAQSGGRTAV